MKNITIIGCGYVGLVTGACLAKMGNQVTCLDIDQDKISLLLNGTLPFYEPGLEELVKEGLAKKHLQFTSDYSQAISESEICFFALPTPSNVDESCDLHYLFEAARLVAQEMDRYLVLVNKSTAPVGTAEKIRETVEEALEKKGKVVAFDIVSNPEFLREGTAVSDFITPDRVLIGVNHEKPCQIMKELYAPFHDRLLVMDIHSAELAKYAANVMLAARLSLMNNLACLCETLGADIDAVCLAIGTDERIGPQYLSAGIGFGGSCLPKDVRALRSIAKSHQHPTSFFDSILEINQRQREQFFKKIENYYESIQGKTFAFWGLSFKPETDDLREAPSLFLIEKLIEKGAFLHIYDPVAMEKAKPLFANESQINFCEDLYQTTEGADGLILVTEWDHFLQVDFDRISSLMKSKAIFDGRNHWNKTTLEQLGFDYFCIGKTSPREMAYP